MNPHPRAPRTWKARLAAVSGLLLAMTFVSPPAQAAAQDQSPGEVPVWVGSGTDRFAFDPVSGTARFQACGVDTGTIDVADAATVDGVMRGTASADGLNFSFELPLDGGQGDVRVTGDRTDTLTGETSRPLASHPKGDWPQLEAAISAVIDASDNRIAVALQDLSDPAGPQLILGDTDPIRAASTYKVAIAAELMRQVDCGFVDLSEEIVVTEEDLALGGGVIQNETLPKTYTLDELSTLMIRNSDNIATNVIIDYLGFDAIQANIDTQQLDELTVGRKSFPIGDTSCVWNSGSWWDCTPEAMATWNFVTAEQLVSEVAAIYRGTSTSPAAQERILSRMAQVADSTRIRPVVPTAATVYNKGGALSGVITGDDCTPVPGQYCPQPGISHDFGVVTLGGHEYALAVLTEGTQSIANDELRRVVRMIHDEMAGYNSEITSGDLAGHGFPYRETRNTPQLADVGPIEGAVTYLGDGCSASTVPGATAAGGIAMVDRVGCPVQQKLNNVTAKNWTALIIMNQASGDSRSCNHLPSNGTLTTSGTIPLVHVWRETGMQILGEAGLGGVDCVSPASVAAPVGFVGESVRLASDAMSGDTGDIDVEVEIPENDGGPGLFGWTIQDPASVNLGAATVNPDGSFSAAGTLPAVIVRDTRENAPAWSLSGSASDFASDAESFGSEALGWAPALVEDEMGALAGDATTAGVDGLRESALLARAVAGHEGGTATVSAALELLVSEDVPVGTYTSVITLTALS